MISLTFTEILRKNTLNVTFILNPSLIIPRRAVVFICKIRSRIKYFNHD